MQEANPPKFPGRGFLPFDLPGGRNMWLRKILRVLVMFGCAVLLPVLAHAGEFYVGEPIVQENLQIVPNYLTGIRMDQMPKGMDMSPDAIHLEADVHATKDEKHGFSEDAWIPYLTINFTLIKQGNAFKKTGTLAAMTAADGLHYANNLGQDQNAAFNSFQLLSMRASSSATPKQSLQKQGPKATSASRCAGVWARSRSGQMPLATSPKPMAADGPLASVVFR